MDADELELKKNLRILKKEELLKRKLSKGSNDRKRDVAYKNNSKTSSIYISDLPTERITKEELTEQFSKYGVIRMNRDGKPHCKLYVNDKGIPKGDALIIYSKEESVTLAIEMMNESNFLGKKIKVERAQFDDRESINIDNKENSTKAPGESERPVKRLKPTNFKDDGETVDYNDDESLAKADRTVVLANVFDIYKQYTQDDINDIKEDLLDGFQEIGQVDNLSVSTDKGKATVVFKRSKDALECCKTMNGRYFDGQKLLTFMLGDDYASEINRESEASDVEDDLIEIGER
ncbi:U2 snRNP complex subunit CUS2 [Saccharomyces eubayanus]|uniref:U2 snRNP complex subunit CUS2 n=1 Tax=Saccharomyces eubayanus TaxID=1080349 RepID=UPI0006C5281E|nr:CUS2-like protein [Saccharomyces eubayanus]KOG96892.1 CUS2-like protein [Saccharomyces eubayanus]